MSPRMPAYSIEFDKDGWFVSCEGMDLCNTHRHSTYEDAEAERRVWEEDDAREAALRRHEAKIADRIDGYDRDDLGESPDY